MPPRGGLRTSLSFSVTGGAPMINAFQPSAGVFSPGLPLVPSQPQPTRAFDFNVGVNTVITPRGGFGDIHSFASLRAYANVEPVRLCIETCKDQIERLDWQIKPTERNAAKAKKAATARSGDILKVEQFFKKPDGVTPFATWLRESLEDLLVIDAPAFERQRNRGGDLIGLEVVQGDTFKLLVDETGRKPRAPIPAYQQIIKGMVWNNLTTDDLIYAPRNPRSNHLYGFCFSPDSEILTRRGWVNVAALVFDDEIATRHPLSHELQYQRPVALTRREFDGELVHFTGKGINVLVTPEHKMIVRARGQGADQLMPAAALASHKNSRSHWRLPLTVDSWRGDRIVSMQFGDAQTKAVERNATIRLRRAEGISYSAIAREVGVSRSTVADVVAQRYAYSVGECGGRHGIDHIFDGNDFCAFMGMYLSEGSINKGRVIAISQKASSKVFEKFSAALSSWFGSVAHESGDFLVHRKPLADYLKRFGHSHEKFVPDEIMGATPDQIAIFLEYLIDGDGHRNTKGQQFLYTTSEKLADQVQELALKIGQCATIAKLEPRGSCIDGREINVANCRPQYRVSINRLKYTAPKASRTPHSGPVHCVSVPNKSVYVRREGVATWTSQSPVEQIIVTINTIMRRQGVQLAYFTDGSVPAGILSAPAGWAAKDIKTMQDAWDARIEGDQTYKNKLQWVPEGTKYSAFKDAPLKDEFDEWLYRIACFTFSLPPTAFVKQMNRATAQQGSDTGKEEGIESRKLWWKRIADDIIQNDLGHPDLEWAWTDGAEVDAGTQSQNEDRDLKNGSRTINEVRDGRGDPPVEGGDQAMVYTPTGPILVAKVVEDALNPPEPPPVMHVLPAPAANDEGAPADPKQTPGDEQQQPHPPKVGATAKLAKGKKPADINRPKAKRTIAKLRKAIRPVLARMGEEVAAEVEGKLRSTTKAADDGAASIKLRAAAIASSVDLSSLDDLADDLYDAMFDIAEDAGEEALGGVGVDASTDMFNQVNKRAVAYAKQRSGSLVSVQGDDSLIASTRNMIGDVIAHGLEDNIGTKAIADKVQTSTAFSEDRADLIARTEVSMANGQGKLAGWKASGVELQKGWQTSNNGACCDDCQDNEDAGLIGIDETFPSGDDAEPAHPSCECATYAEVATDDGE